MSQRADGFPCPAWLYTLGFAFRAKQGIEQEPVAVASNAHAVRNGRHERPHFVTEGQFLYRRCGCRIDHVSNPNMRAPDASLADHFGFRIDAETSFDFPANCLTLRLEVQPDGRCDRIRQRDALSRRFRTQEGRCQLICEASEISFQAFGKLRCLDLRAEPWKPPGRAGFEVPVQGVHQGRQPRLSRVAGPDKYGQRAQLDASSGNRSKIGHVKRQWSNGGHGSVDPSFAYPTVQK